MRLPLIVAWRYLFAKKSTNAINVITGVTIAGLGVGTAALILVLSVFNGFEDLLVDLMNSMNADLKVTPVRGKTFEVDSSVVKRLNNIAGVTSVSLSLQETAMLEYDGKQDFCTLKGVDDHYNKTTTIESALVEGSFTLHEESFEYIILGAGIANRLDVNYTDPFEPVSVYMPKREQRGFADRPFKKKLIYPKAKFSIKQDYDYTYAFCSLQFIRDLLDKPGEASAIELKIAAGHAMPAMQEQVADVVGPAFAVRNRYEQDEALFKLMRVEKWMSYAIAGLTLLIVSFNLIGALWMIVLDKKQDLSVLRAMGARKGQIRDIVLWEGMLICGLGIVLGIVVAVGVFALQKNFGIVAVPEGFVVEAYPIVLNIRDFIVVTITVLTIGALASVLPARKGALIPAFIREE